MLSSGDSNVEQEIENRPFCGCVKEKERGWENPPETEKDHFKEMLFQTNCSVLYKPPPQKSIQIKKLSQNQHNCNWVTTVKVKFSGEQSL